MKNVLRTTLAALISLLLSIYGSDSLWIRYRSTKGAGAFGSVTVYRYYSIEKKANRVEYDFLDKENQICVHSLFPHMGFAPCWYLKRHTEKKIDI